MFLQKFAPKLHQLYQFPQLLSELQIPIKFIYWKRKFPLLALHTFTQSARIVPATVTKFSIIICKKRQTKKKKEKKKEKQDVNSLHNMNLNKK
jgi:hypothetical protein